MEKIRGVIEAVDRVKILQERINNLKECLKETDGGKSIQARHIVIENPYGRSVSISTQHDQRSVRLMVKAALAEAQQEHAHLTKFLEKAEAIWEGLR